MESTFRQGDLIAHRNADYPGGARAVHGADPEGNLLVHPLGGGFEMRLSSADLAGFDRVSDEERVPVFTRGTFGIDGIEGDRPRSNLTYVKAPDSASLACLQSRLNELGENIATEIKKW